MVRKFFCTKREANRTFNFETKKQENNALISKIYNSKFIIDI